MVDDYDLTACLKYNPQFYSIDQIAEILAVWEGEHDGGNWIWVLRIKKECLPNPLASQFMLLEAGCDYTGWDCRSWVDDIQYRHEISSFEKPLQDILNSRLSLLKQLNKGKAETWREKMDKEFGLSKQEEN